LSALRLYDTLAREKRRFEPLDPAKVRIYSCGPTVYSHQHLGNMRAYLFADLLKRALLWFGHPVFHVINITDVGHLTDDADAGEDKMERAARQSGESIWDVAERWTRIFKRDLERLHVLPPDVWCKATDHIAEQIEMIRQLETKGFTYRTGDGIYFDTAKDPGYGQLARLHLEQQESQERVEGADQKRNRADFALWKLSPPDGPRRQMEWPSPWGSGFPGWHIECSAMSTKYLGQQFDIHTGGVDHIPVHHTNEIAQSENALGVRPWVRFWMHGGWLMFEGDKMSKSRGSVRTLDDLDADGIEPEAFRLFLLGSHYRQQTSFGDEALRGAQNAWRRLTRRVAELREGPPGASDPAAADTFRQRFRAALADDLNAPQALAVVWELVRADAPGAAEKLALLESFDRVLGLELVAAASASAEPEGDARIDALVAEREAARKARDFKRADAIREQLRAEGIALEDGPQGPRWRRA
jgi:cysteinyl-tRNA synthetase